MPAASRDEPCEQLRPLRVEPLVGVGFGRRAAGLTQTPRKVAVVMHSLDSGSECVGVVDVGQQPFSTVLDDRRRLADPGADERDARSHRLEHALRAALLPRGDEVGVERVIGRGEPVP